MPFCPAVSLVLANADVEAVLLKVLIQLGIIIVAARVFAIAFRKIGQPAVVGEIIAGLVLGPSLLQRLAPGLWDTIFTPHDPVIPHLFEILSQLGLIFLLFLIGLEFDFSHLRRHGRSSLLISIAGIALPFTLGVGLAHGMYPYVGQTASGAIDLRGFSLFMGTAMSITAIPILGRMMMELGITRTRLGAITITAAAIDDATGWILLATVTALVSASGGGELNLGATAKMVLETAAFAALMMWVARPLLSRWIQHALRTGKGELGPNSLAILFVVIFLCAIATNLIGIFAIFGAFILGAVLSGEHAFRDAIARQLRNFITVFFLPIFFTYTGLRTKIGSLDSGALWIMAGLVLLAAVAGKYGGCLLAARVSGFSWRESSLVGVMMNTRALMELIVINVGYQLGVIPETVFCMLVLMAVITTVMTTPILLKTLRGTELEAPIAASGFLRRKRPAEDLEEAALLSAGAP
jgi:Kef-type K+ transport system membrane component KefB